VQEVRIIWDDITHYNEWQTLEDARKLEPKRFQTRGWLITNTQKKAIVACTIDLEATVAVSNVVVIPKRAIVKIEEDESGDN